MYGQILLAISFAIASYQDLKSRAVSDIVWLPAIAGVSIILYSLATSSAFALLEFELGKIAIIGVVVVILYYLGIVGQADLIMLIFFVADPYIWSFFIATIGALIVMVPQVVYQLIKGGLGGKKVIPVEQFLREQQWIPRAVIQGEVRSDVDRDVNVAREEVTAKQTQGMLVEVQWGAPTLAYFGIGYIIYFGYLVLFNQVLFMALP